MSKKLIYDSPIAKLWHDDENDTIIKECVPGTLDLKSMRHYMEFQKTTPGVVKVLDIIDDNTFVMERLRMVCTILPLLSYHKIAEPSYDDFNSWIKTKFHNSQFHNYFELQKIMDTSSVAEILKNFNKQNLFDLIKTVNDVHSSSLMYSKKLPSNFVFSLNDFKLQNIVMIKDPESLTIKFKVIDPNSWGLFPGYYAIETYYHTQLHLAFITQALVKEVFE